VSWATGKGADGNGDLADLVGATRGAVGYVELSYALDRKLAVAAVENHAGRFVTPSSTTAAVAAQDLAGLSAVNDFQVSPAATTAPDAYPITTYTFLVVFQRQFDVAKGTALLRLLRYVTGEGQASATGLHYAPLPRPCASSSSPSSGCSPAPTARRCPPLTRAEGPRPARTPLPGYPAEPLK